MPHKRAKRSVRDQQRAERKTDLPPSSSQLDDIPRGVSRVLNAVKIREAYKERKRKSQEGDDEAKGKKRRKVDGNGVDETSSNKKGPLKIKHGESLAHFSNRVEHDMRPSIEAAYRTSRKMSSKANLKDSEEKAGTKEQKKAKHGPSEDHDTAKSHGLEQDAKHDRKQPLEFKTISSSAPKRLNDIVMAPPELPRLRRSHASNDSKSKTKSILDSAKNASVVSAAQKRMMEIEREKAILRYRALKEAKEKARLGEA